MVTLSKIVKGKRYRVIKDSAYYFNPGDIVVAMESHPVPYCILESKYREGLALTNHWGEVHALFEEELEEVEG